VFVSFTVGHHCFTHFKNFLWIDEN